MHVLISDQLQFSLRKESGDLCFQWVGDFTIDLRKHVMPTCRQKHLHHRREKCEVNYDFFIGTSLITPKIPWQRYLVPWLIIVTYEKIRLAWFEFISSTVCHVFDVLILWSLKLYCKSLAYNDEPLCYRCRKINLNLFLRRCNSPASFTALYFNPILCRINTCNYEMPAMLGLLLMDVYKLVLTPTVAGHS